MPDVHEEIIAALDALRARYDYVDHHRRHRADPRRHHRRRGGRGVRRGALRASRDHRPDRGAGENPAGRGDERRDAADGARAGGRRAGAKLRAAPPGFTIGNVFVLAGVPTIMRAMLEDVGHRLKGGVVTVSRTVRVEGSGESVIAAPLEAVAKAHPAMSLGSYPFFDGPGLRLEPGAARARSRGAGGDGRGADRGAARALALRTCAKSRRLDWPARGARLAVRITRSVKAWL